jgi:hypothetical protein
MAPARLADYIHSLKQVLQQPESSRTITHHTATDGLRNSSISDNSPSGADSLSAIHKATAPSNSHHTKGLLQCVQRHSPRPMHCSFPQAQACVQLVFTATVSPARPSHPMRLILPCSVTLPNPLASRAKRERRSSLAFFVSVALTCTVL